MAKYSLSEAEQAELAEHYRYPGFLLRRLNQISISLFMQRMENLGITPLQYTIVRIVGSEPGLTQKAIATKAVLDAATTHDIISRLEAKDLVTRRQGTKDRRARAVYLTKQGQAAWKRADPVVRETQHELLSSLTPGQRDTLIKLLTKLVEDNLNRVGLDGPPGPWSRQARGRKGEL